MNFPESFGGGAILAAVAFVAIAIVSGAANWLVLGLWRRTAGQHWTERARALYRARCVCGLNNGLLIGCAIVVGINKTSDSFPWHTLSGAFVGAFLGAVAGTFPLQRAVFPSRTVRSWIAAVAVGLSFKLVGAGLFIGCVLAMPRHFGAKAWMIAGGWMALQLALDFGVWLRLMRLMRLVRPPSDRLTRIVAEASRRTGIIVRAVWELPSPECQAIAFIMTRNMAFTRGLMEHLSDAEIESICLHELAHLAEPQRTVWLFRLLALLPQLPILFTIPAVAHFGASAPWALLCLFYGLVFASVRLRRRMELHADRMAATEAPDPAIYARALEKICEANQTPAVLGGRFQRTHADLYDRMASAGVTPDYPRPKKPGRYHWSSAALLILVAATVAIAVARS